MARTAPFSDLRWERSIAAMSIAPILAPIGRWLLLRRFRQTANSGNRRRLIGLIGEAAAARHLRQGRYRILAVNRVDRIGEIDLLALAPTGELVVAEVKSSLVQAKATADRHYPEQRVDGAKARRLQAIAGQMARHPRWRNHAIRLDILAVDLDPESLKSVGIRHHLSAIQAAG